MSRLLNEGRVLAAVLTLCPLSGLAAESSADLFPFVLPWDDQSPPLVSVEPGPVKSAGADGFVRIADGHFVVGASGAEAKRLRLLGVNISFGSNFLEQDQADKVAGRLARFGVNAVRFHHMDGHPAPRGIFLPDRKTLDPAQLDKLDYFFSRLKAQGIYGDINLKVSRLYPEFAERKDLPTMHKGIDLFSRSLIEAQKQYARDLLTHVNPYTKLAYVDDPAVALVEINNENGLVSSWWQKKIDKLPEPFQSELQGLWKKWLAGHYGSLDSAVTQCAPEEAPLGATVLALSPVEETLKAWTLRSNKTTPDPAPVLVARKESYLQLHLRNDIAGNDEAAEFSDYVSPDFSLKQDKLYTITLRARGTPGRTVSVELRPAGAGREPMQAFQADVTSEWHDFSFSFKYSPATESPLALCLAGLEKKAGFVEIAAFSVREGGSTGRALEVSGEMPQLIARADYSKRTPELRRAWMRFLWDTETAYWKEMYHFLKRDLGVRCPILGTQLGAYSVFPIQQEMDVVDIHTYWKHPQYPDPANRNVWSIGAESMMEDIGGGTVPATALRRVAGKPFVCTEYNHCTPNLYAAEGFILGAAYAALQDMDALFVYSYSHYPDKLDRQSLPGMFDVDQHPLKMATLPIASALFVRGDVQPAKTRKVISILPEEAFATSMTRGTRVDGFAFGVSPMDPLRQRVELTLTQDSQQAVKPGVSSEVLGREPIRSDTGELKWIPVRGAQSVCTVDTPRSKCVVGFSDGGRYSLGEVTFAASQNWNGWSVLALTSQSGKNLGEVGSALLVACGRAENTGWEWTNGRKEMLKSWGKAPSVVNGIQAEVQWTLPSGRKLSVWALDELGKRRTAVPVVESVAGRWTFHLDASYRTIWYEVQVQ